jgi:AcrR family transcriptional regulator
MAVSHRDLLLQAAKRCLRDRGYVNTTARDLVAESGTNLGSIGYHFGSKEALLNEALEELFVDWTRRITDAATAEATASALQQTAASWVAMLGSMPAHRPLLQAFVDSLGPTIRSPKLRKQLADHYQEGRASIGRIVADALGPEAVAAGADPEVVASFLIAVADGFVIQFLVDPKRCPSGEQFVSALGHALEAAMRATQASA